MDILSVALGLFLSGLLKGTTGIGFSTCALPFLVAAVGLNKAMALVVVPAIACNVSLMVRLDNTTQVLERFWKFYAAIIPGIAIGAGVLAGSDARLATQMLGVLTVSYVLLAVTRPDLRLGVRGERRLAGPAGFANGLLTGLTGSQVLPLMPYMMALRLSPAEQVQAVNIAVTIGSAILAAALLATGLVSGTVLALSCAGILPALLGVDLGNRLRSRLANSQFRSLSLGVLALLGVSLLVQGTAPLRPDCNDVYATAKHGQVCGSRA